MIPELRDLSYEEAERMWFNNSRDKEVKRRSENIDRNMFFSLKK